MVASAGGAGASSGEADRFDRRQRRRRRAVRECQTPGVDKSPDLPSKPADLETHGGFSEDFWRSEIPPHWGKT